MYLVNAKIFRTFLDKKNIATDAIVATLPCIVEYNKDGVLMAKVEVTNKREFKMLQDGANKYWIRGDEWQMVDGKPVMGLRY
jgi:hypothetical protein